jgi:rhodanese-related sulfurtransferase
MDIRILSEAFYNSQKITSSKMENNKEKEKKEQIAVIIGFFLILIVIIITLFRSKLFESQNDSSQLNSQSNQEITSLGYKTINAKDLQKKILLADKNSNITLLDIRPFASYAQEHIVDAVNITPSEFPLDSKIDVHSFVVVVGENSSDGDIKTTVDELKKENFDNFLVLAGGMETWKQLGQTTVTYGDPTLFTDQAKVSYVDGEKLNEALKQKVAMFIIDVRSGEDYAKGHIPGAINIPADDIEKRRKEITEKRVVVVGINELQEFQSSVQMYDMLLASPFVLRGAMPGWEQKGFPITK